VTSTQETSASSAPDGVFFSGKTTRGDFWKNELNAPYTKATFNVNPGPG
jgi:hypothetical protein